MMKIKILMVAFILCASSVYGSDNPYKNVENIKTMTADFTQINTIKDFGDDEYKGKLFIISGEKALWDYYSPNPAWYLFSKDSVSQYDSITNQLIVYGSEQLASNMLLQILLDFRKVSEKFTPTISGDTVKLLPKTDIGVKYLNITFKNGLIDTMESEDGAGNISRIIFSNVSVNKPIDDKMFLKEPPKDAEIFQAQ